MLSNRTILITNRRHWFFRQGFHQTILACYPDVKRLIVFNRDELKQYELYF